MADKQPTPIPKFIRRLMPSANDVELCAAADTFAEYLAVVLRIYNRTKKEQSSADSHESESHGRVGNDPAV